MVRNSKFGFSLTSRKSSSARERDQDRAPSGWTTPRGADSLPPSKVERLLGASIVTSHASPANLSSSPYLRKSPSNLSTAASFEPTRGADHSSIVSAPVMDEYARSSRSHPLNARASSNILGRSYKEDASRTESVTTTTTRQMHHQGSSSTLRSYYDAKKSPLSVSQQTSASAVRDMALRKGYPKIQASDSTARTELAGTSSPIFPPPHVPKTPSESQRSSKRGRPARLDLSRLFPRPKTQEDLAHNLLSPNKLVRSPSQLSAASEYFPRNHQQKQPSPALTTAQSIRSLRTLDSRSNKLQKGPPTVQRRYVPQERDVLDNAKVNVRRPPKGIQHWFEGLLEDSDEDLDEVATQLPKNDARSQQRPSHVPVRQSSLGRVRGTEPSADRLSRTANRSNAASMSNHHQSHHNHRLAEPARPRSPSQQSNTSHATSKSKSGALSSANLHSASVLSMSSDEEDEQEDSAQDTTRMSTFSSPGDNIIIGKAQAFEVNPRSRGPSTSRVRDASESRQSARSTGTNAATIDVMLCTSTEEQLVSTTRQLHNHKTPNSRYPASIPEDDPYNTTSASSPPEKSSPGPLHSASRSTRSARSDSLARREQHKLMAVTEEEEALLEMMRRKRAAMAKHSFAEGYKTALRQEQQGPSSRPETRGSSHAATPRSSVLAANESPTKQTITLFPGPPAGSGHRQSQYIEFDDLDLPNGTQASEQQRSTPEHHRGASSKSYQLDPPLNFPPLDPFPSPTRTATIASMASPTTASHASPLPSPVTPEHRQGDHGMQVKVASSEPSCHGDEDESGIVHESQGHIDYPRKEPASRNDSMRSSSVKRRTASSDAEIVPGVESLMTSESYPVPNIAVPRSQQLDEADNGNYAESLRHNNFSRTASTATRNARSGSRSSRSARVSIASSSAGYAPTVNAYSSTSGSFREKSSYLHGNWESRNSKSSKRASLSPSVTTSCSVSEDVLAAWGSLGGWRDFDTNRV